MSDQLQAILQNLQDLSVAEALAIFAGLMVLESLGAPVPSEVVLPAAGWWVRAAGWEPAWEGLALVCLTCTVGSLIGCILAYAIGFYGGRPLVLRLGRWLLISSRSLDRAERWLEGRGAWAVAGSRLVFGLRALVSYPLGATGMPLGKYVVFTLLGISVFDATFVWLGWRFGETISRLLSSWGLVAVGVVLVTVLLWLGWARRGGLMAFLRRTR